MSPRAIAALGVAGAILALVVWALAERSARLACKASAAELQGAYLVLAGATQRQSAAIADLEAKASLARVQAHQAAIAAAAEAKAAQPAIDALGASLAAPTPPAQGCHEALEQIRGLL